MILAKMHRDGAARAANVHNHLCRARQKCKGAGELISPASPIQVLALAVFKDGRNLVQWATAAILNPGPGTFPKRCLYIGIASGSFAACQPRLRAAPAIALDPSPITLQFPLPRPKKNRKNIAPKNNGKPMPTINRSRIFQGSMAARFVRLRFGPSGAVM